MERKYYLIKNRILGMVCDEGAFIIKDNILEEDNDNIIRDHLFGYDPYDDSHYGMFNSYIMDEIKEITKDEFVKYIKEGILWA